MISELLSICADRKLLKLDAVRDAAEADHAQGNAEREISHSDDSALPFEAVQFSNFRDKTGELLPTRIEVTITHLGGGYISSMERAEGVTHKEIVVISDHLGPIKRWTEERFQPKMTNELIG